MRKHVRCVRCAVRGTLLVTQQAAAQLLTECSAACSTRNVCCLVLCIAKCRRGGT